MPNYYDLPEDRKTITKENLKDKPAEFQIEIMRTWFYQRYQDPVHECPYIGREGGYQYIHGGPYEAGDELSCEFGEFIHEDIIEELVSELQNECYEWSGISRAEDYDDYDDYLFDISGSVVNPSNEFHSSIENLRSMISMEIPHENHQQTLLNMVFTSVITSMEVFLSEYFIGRIEREPHYLRKFVESNVDFTKEKFPLSDVFERRENIGKYTKEYLVGLLWHNLPKIRILYKNALGIDFPQSVEKLVKATHIRHDLVHRAGKSKEGNSIILHKNDIIELIDEVERLAKHIDEAGTPEF